MASPLMSGGGYHSSNPYHQQGTRSGYHSPSTGGGSSHLWAASPSSLAVVPGGHSPRPIDWNTPSSSSAGIIVNDLQQNDQVHYMTGAIAGVGASGSATGSGGRISARNSISTGPVLLDDDADDLDDDDLDDDDQPGGGGSGNNGGDGGEGGDTSQVPEKKKSTRGSRACTVCRKLKMRCVGAEQGPPCKRCKNGNHECVFEESQRGRRSNRKTDMMAKSLKKMEATLETVLKSISQPGMLQSSGLMTMQEPSALSRPTLSPHESTSANTVGGAPSTSEIPIGASPHTFQQQQSSVSSGSPSFGDLKPSGPARSQIEWSGVRGDRTQSNVRDDSPRLHSLPDNTLNPLGLLAEASLQNTRKRTAVTINDVLEPNWQSKDGSTEPPFKREKLGMGNPQYFMPGPMNILPLRRIVIEQRGPPDLLEEKIVSVEEVVELFSIYFEHCHRHAPVLDADIHTPAAVGSRSPFLFTCICTVAARYYTKRKDDLYRKCHRVAMRVAFDVMTKGYKSVEICQGFLLLCAWNQPAERFEEERTYQFSGIAIRMATDLNLHRKTIANLPGDVSDETRTLYQRELMNRERTWMYSFICDRSVATQMGKPSSIPKEDYIIRNAKTWFLQPGSQPSDSGLSAMAEMHRQVGRMIDVLYSDTRTVSGLNANLNYTLLMKSFLGQLDQWKTDWTEGVATLPAPNYTPDVTRDQMRDFYHGYYRMFLLSFAIQHALDSPQAAIDLPAYTVMIFESASKMVIIARDTLEPKGRLRYAMDSTFVYLAYAATFVLKLVSPSFSHIIEEKTAISLVREVADTFARAAIDESHTPALYASFLRALIDNKLNGGRTVPPSRAPTRPSSPVPNATGVAAATSNNPTHGLDSYLKSRAGSVQPEGGSDATAAGADGNLNGDQAFDPAAMDSMLSGGFWDNMLMMPGSIALSGGTGMMLGNMSDHWSVTPMHSRPGSPNAFASGGAGNHQFGQFDFNSANSSTGGL